MTRFSHLEQDVDDGDSQHAPIGVNIFLGRVTDQASLMADVALMAHRHPADDDVDHDDDDVGDHGRRGSCEPQLRRHHVQEATAQRAGPKLLQYHRRGEGGQHRPEDAHDEPREHEQHAHPTRRHQGLVAQTVHHRDEALHAEDQQRRGAADGDAEVVALHGAAHSRRHLAAEHVVRAQDAAAEQEPGLAEREVADGLEHGPPPQRARRQDRDGGDAGADGAHEADHHGAGRKQVGRHDEEVREKQAGKRTCGRSIKR